MQFMQKITTLIPTKTASLAIKFFYDASLQILLFQAKQNF